MSGHATFVGMVFVDLAAAANSDSHLLLRRIFCAEYAVFSRPCQDKRILSPVLVTARCDVAEGLSSFQLFSRWAAHLRPRLRLV